MAEKTPVTKKDVTIRGKRSPNYPTINLEKAISMVSCLYDKFQRHPVPAPLSMEAMGYSIKSGRAQSMLASVSYYDLIQMERGAIETKKVNISPIGFTILKNPDTKARDEAIREAALRPSIFKKLITKFPSELPNDSLLAWELENNFDFNARSIPDFIEILKQTLNYAKTYEVGIMEEGKETPEEDKPDEEGDKDMEGTLLKPSPPKNRVPGQGSEIAKYRVNDDITVSLVSTGPLSVKDIEKLIKHLAIDWEDINVEIKPSKTSNNES